jgi:hypothetical protein
MLNIPTYIAEAHDVLNLIYVKTKQNENVVLVKNKKENIIFSCEKNHRFL